MSIPDRMTEQARRFERAARSRGRMLRWERKVAIWMVGWNLIVLVAYLAHFYRPEIISWMIVAWVATMESALVMLLVLVNARKWHAVIRMKAAEEDALSGNVDQS